MAGDHFDPWTASESEARAATLRMGFDPLHVDLVRGRASHLAQHLLPSVAPLRRWCAAGQVQALREEGEARLELAQLMRAQVLCSLHGLVPPGWLTSALTLRLAEAGQPTNAARTDHRRLTRERRAAWVLMRRYRWAHGADASKDVLWQAIVNRAQLADDGDLELGLTQAIRRLPMGKSKAQQRLAEAEVLLGPPAWPVAHVPPPLE
jgi:acyl dehydratase